MKDKETKLGYLWDKEMELAITYSGGFKYYPTKEQMRK